MPSISRAEDFKSKGNAAFQRGDYKTAEELYSQAIICDSTNPTFFTNRALVRSKQSNWDAVMQDCRKALDLVPNSLKAHHYMGLALLRLGRPNEALKHSQEAYKLAIAFKSPSASQIVEIILEGKKLRWEAKEKQRIAAESELLEETCQMYYEKARNEKAQIMESMRGKVSEEYLQEELSVIDYNCDQKVARIRDVFAMSDEKHRIRKVPEYLLDNISFTIMTDPVVTKHGQSYDRATILEHLRRSKTDPLTREPMTEEDLRPNLALKEACEEFLENNGWVVDY